VHTIRFGIIALSSMQHLHHIILLLHVGKFICRYCNENIIIVKFLNQTCQLFYLFAENVSYSIVTLHNHNISNPLSN
jgi:hypothetical protein